MRRQDVESGSTAWEAAILTVIPPTLLIENKHALLTQWILINKIYWTDANRILIHIKYNQYKKIIFARII